MPRHVDNGNHDKLCRKVQPAFAQLLEAFVYADDSNCDVWEFAVGIRSLRELGLRDIDFWWLVRSGYVAHAREMKLSGDPKRQFRPEGRSVFSKRTCFVLTEVGVSKARAITADQTSSADDDTQSIERNVKARGQPVEELVPHWDEETHELRLGGKMVKRYKWQAVNQQLVLSSFQEEGWPSRIDDPLPPQPDQESKRRLSDTIKCLNRKQENALIHFRGDGTGEGVIWELVSGDTEGQD